MTDFVLVTGNDDKWREAQRILGRPLAREKLDLPELQASTTAEVALHKVRAAFELLRRPVIVEDAGVELGAFGSSFVVEGRTPGTIAASPRGTGGFGWDAIFIPDGDTRTFAEMTGEEKDRLSHRRRAWEKLALLV